MTFLIYELNKSDACNVYMMVNPLCILIFQDPDVMAAFQDVAQNPANISKYQSNPKIMVLINKLSSKFGGQQP